MMQKQKIKIPYRTDDSFNNILSANNSQKTPEGDRSFQFNIDQGLFGKRHKAQIKPKDLGKLVMKYKVEKLTQNFIKKLRLNSVYRNPQEMTQASEPQAEKSQTFLEQFKNCFHKYGQKKGISIGNIGLIIWSITNIIQITLMVFVFCIMMAFPETQDFSVFLFFRMVSIVLYVIDMFLNFTVKRYESGKYLQKIHQIASDYAQNGLLVDLVSILIFPIDVLVNTKTNITIFISFVALIKLVNNIRKFQKFQYLLINSSGKEHYFGLIKVFLTNFAIGHFLSICLNLMASLNEDVNWQIKLGIEDAQWYIKYIWGYYWGTNIMLTVGFGDICASNYYEAILLVFIETFSCITLAYNINYVGALIGSLRESQEQKKKKLKIFHRMCKENFLPNQMESRIGNFIEEEYRIKESFEYDEHDQVLKSLPKNLQIQFRKEANKTLFDNIGFLNNLSKKSLYKLAEVISRRICHPEEIVVAKGSVTDFMILQKGTLSSVCRIRSSIDGMEIEQITIKEGEKPKILSLNFIKNKSINYNIKSKTYTVLYYLSREQIMQSLRSSEMDSQMFSQLKDKDEKFIDQNNLYNCSICKTQFHSKFQCSRLHFIPLKRKVILKNIFEINKVTQRRWAKFQRTKRVVKPSLCAQELKQEQKKYIQENFDDDHYREIQNLFNFYSKLNQSFTKMKQHQTFQTQFADSHKSNLKLMLDDKALVRLEQMLENKASKVNFNIWEFQIDQAENYSYYFREGNPDQLKKGKKNRRNKGIFTYNENK